MKYLLCFFALAVSFSQIELAAQHIHYTTLHGDCEDTDSSQTECEPSQSSCCHHHRHWTDPNPDPVTGELFYDSGWPSRRDQLSDELTR